MTDKERTFAARRFFWEIVDKWPQNPPDVATAQRQITKLAECLPPFTQIRDIRA